MNKKLLIVGAGGHGRVIADIALKMKAWKNIYFLDDNPAIKSTEVIGESNDVYKYIQNFDIFIGIGNNIKREKIQEKVEFEGASIPTLIHPNAIIGRHVDVGVGTVIMAGAIINCNTKIGKGCIINTGATIDHDNLVEDYTHISPGVHLAGTVKVGRGSWLGIGSVVSNNINIANGSNVGAGAVVIRNITEPGTYIGVPARRV